MESASPVPLPHSTGSENPDLYPVTREMLHEQIFTILKRNLMMGRFAPGQKLPLRWLAKSLGTSAMPVRDALQRLESIGCLVSTPARTMMVPVLSVKEQQDISRLRVLLESEAVAAAATARSEQQLATLASCCADIRRSADTADLDLFLEANYRFHMEIAEASGISFIASLLEPLWMRIGPLVRMSTPDHAHILRSVGFHEKVYDAIIARNAEAARIAITADIIESNMPIAAGE